jgi:predicted ATPase
MQIDIKNFGPINRFSYDLSKDFIVTYGDNNIGKSYAMQIVYLLIKNLIEFSTVGTRYIGSLYTASFGIVNENNYEKCDKIIKGFLEQKVDSKDITKNLTDILFETIGEAVISPFMNSCDNTFGNFEKTLEKEPVILIDLGSYCLNIDLKEGTIIGTTDIKPIYLKKSDTDYFKAKNYKTYEAVYVSKSNIDKPVGVLSDIIRKMLGEFAMFINRNFDNVYFLPASRSGIYSGMNAFGSIVAELSKNRAYLTRKIELPGISEPISDYFINLSSIKQKVSDKYAEFYNKIEDRILKGKVSFDKNKNALVYVPNEMELQFEMTEVSSMVSEVSPIVAFLKYILAYQNRRPRFLASKSILFIEEPEAHLHPKNQIELIEIFAELVSAGIKLIISSHSNYVFNKLNNLVLAKKLDYKVYQPIFLDMTVEGSFSRFMHIDDLGVDDENFVDVSEKLYFEREEIIQQLNMEAE